MARLPPVIAMAIALGAAAPPGHLKPLGHHQPPVAPIDQRDSFPDPASFYREYVRPRVPLLIKGGAKDQPGYELWSDEYLTRNYGRALVEVEEGKKEDRDQGLWTWRLVHFLRQYHGDMYSVSAVPIEMRHEYNFPRSLNCPAYTNQMAQLNHWFSSGGTVSVLHADSFENINCLLDGEKQILMFSYNLTQEHLHWDHRPNHGHSAVDPDSVDMIKFPGFQDLEYWRVDMHKGDCLFIPVGWYHQVRSGRPGERNLGINIWFHTPDVDAEQCTDPSTPLPVSAAEFHGQEFPLEQELEEDPEDEDMYLEHKMSYEQLDLEEEEQDYLKQAVHDEH
eukprot:TRINITY_DN1137_c0_g1_i3.p1 TRINITY_DN1137_c0_g1~~TRINITY_DN1137_c0_g1_i3.p1  ORF type:complete len:335 (+),score=67.71 TRINITY_DN1137_c0_g1_i3:197-1201(+)